MLSPMTRLTQPRGRLIVLAAFAALLTVGGGCPGPAPPGEAQRFTYRVLAAYPHDDDAFTQGLVYDGGRLYEGTGLYGGSSVREVELTTGAVARRTDLDRQYFGEGIAVAGGAVYQLTWRRETGFIYDADTLEQTGTFAYAGEGWGLTYDGERFIRSDGTARLYFHDPATFGLLGEVMVTEAGRPVPDLNELEYIGGEVWANVWRTDELARIDPETGDVVAWVDLTGLLPAQDRGPDTDVLNGIAYDAAGGRLFVTGKRWPKLFHIELVPAA